MNAESKEAVSIMLHHKEYRKNTVVGAEVLVVLDMFAVIEWKGRRINEGKLEIGSDNREIYRAIAEDIEKISTCARDAGVEIAEIRRILRKKKFKIE